MARPYSEQFLAELHRNDSNSLGVRLARLCVNANLPATYIAVALETTRTTVYSWFRGQGIRENKHNLVHTFIELVETDMATGVLPAKTMLDAKRYIEQMIGTKIN